MRHKLLVALFWAAAAVALYAQPKQNSPYSRFGIGDMAPIAYANQLGMGGQVTANHDPYHLNLGNPASFARLRTTTLETALYSKYSQYSSSSASYSNPSGNIAYLSLGFTLKSPVNAILDRVKSPWHFGMGLALTPHSIVGYDIASTDSTAALGRVNNYFEGNGGTYRLTWSGAARYKHTALGMNIGYTFGRMQYENTTEIRDRFPTFQSTFRDALNVGGAFIRLGAQHDFILKYAQDKESPEQWITIGATFEGQHNLATAANILRVRSRQVRNDGTFFAPDTLLFLRNAEREITLPGKYSFGVQYVNVDKFKIGIQYDREQWGAYRNTARPETMRNVQAISAGVEIIPDYASYNRYLKRVRYRIGAYWREDPRIINQSKFIDIGVTAGLGFPIVLPRQGTSFVNIALQAGQIGADSPVKETYYRATVGFTLNDNSWFYKRRFE
jgi:hypothetical protein